MIPPPADAPRSWHEWYAGANGWFWIPCPTCDRHFGGHEWLTPQPGRASTIPGPNGPGHSLMICPACTAADRGVDQFAELRQGLEAEAGR